MPSSVSISFTTSRSRTCGFPALVGFVEAPFVLGPVGGGPRVPFRLYPELGAVGAAREVARGGLQVASRLNPLTRASWSRADDDRRPE